MDLFSSFAKLFRTQLRLMKMKKNKILTLIIILIFSTIYSYSQKVDASKIYKIDIERNKSDKLKNLYLGINFFNVDIYTPNINFSLGANAEYNFKNKIILDFSFSSAYADRWNEDNPKDLNTNFTIPLYISQPITSFEYIGKIILYSHFNDCNLRVFVKSEGKYNYFVNVKEKDFIIYASRFGYKSFYSEVATNGTGGTLTPFSGYLINTTPQKIETFNQNRTSMMTANMFVYGISRIRYTDIKVNIEDFGEKNCHEMSEIYFDYLFAPKVVLHDILVSEYGYYDLNGNIVFTTQGSTYPSYATPQNFFYQYNINENTKKSPFGFRLGYKYTDLKNKINLMWGTELGCRPGYGTLKDNVYLLFKVGFNFAEKIL